MDARQSKRGKRLSKRQEAEAASDLGGRTMAASGATRLGGGADVRVMGQTRVECKVTEKDTYTIKVQELEKLRKQAIKSLESPVFQFAFRYPTGKMTKYAIIPWHEGHGGQQILLHTQAKQYQVTERALEEKLYKGRIQLGFETRSFEILRWHDYIERMTIQPSKET